VEAGVAEAGEASRGCSETCPRRRDQGGDALRITRKTKEKKDGNHTMKEPTSERLLAEHAEKPVRVDPQIDRWSVPSEGARGGSRS
jgi:hypothetical protein